MIYLLHFDKPYAHAAHYLGFCEEGNLEKRLDVHRSGHGARLMEVISAAGINFTLARTWEGDRNRERQLKKQGGHSRKCPICREAKTR